MDWYETGRFSESINNKPNDIFPQRGKGNSMIESIEIESHFWVEISKVTIHLSSINVNHSPFDKSDI